MNLKLFATVSKKGSVSIKGQKDPEVEVVTAKIRKLRMGYVCYDNESSATKEKTIAFLYQHAVCFLPTDMVKGNFPLSENFCKTCLPFLITGPLFIILT